MVEFEQTFSYKVIYVFSMPYDDHKGLLKVGDTTLKTNIPPCEIEPNSRLLNVAAKERIDRYTKTASLKYNLLYTELAVKMHAGYCHPFRDKDVHKVLMNSRIRKVQPNGNSGDEWFETNLDMVKAAIKAVKEGKPSLSAEIRADNKAIEPVELRKEQLDAIEKTIKTFKKDNEMLWYAKMRFGKTLTALEVIRRCQYRRVIIVTHRPVVDDGWSEDFNKIFFPGNSEHDYHYERKTADSYYVFNEKTDFENDLKIRKLDKDGSYFIYFASIQDLRGSQLVGGNFNKNNAVFDLDWDLIVIDEAHEGTQTELGDTVIKKLKKKDTKVLALSGTPFNLLSQFGDDNVYTWDYVMEQKMKTEWDLLHFGDHNPYADLPKMHIFTYDLGDTLREFVTDEYETKAFNFKEFFRVWYRGPNSNRELPAGAIEGKFVHEDDVLSFLNLLVKDDSKTGYPYSTQEYRDMFKHTLWMVPGVKEAKALSELLRNHPVFKEFGIANVAGEGDKFEEEKSQDALELVRNTIKNNEYSITLSCGKLTTGVTVKEWTAVLMLSGSYSTAAAQYMQTIFRVQSAGTIDGKQKTDCYVFDFAPDRTLKVLTETVHLSRKPGKNDKKRREALKEFLNFCPVISIAESTTRKYSVESMMEQIKQIYAERAVNSGFEDESLYNDDLLKLDEIDASKFNELKDIIGSSKAEKKKKEVVVNGQGLTDEQVEKADDSDEKTEPKKLTKEQLEEQKRIKQAKEARKKAIDILRGISIRMPLMIYGADVPIDEDISIDNFIKIVDDESWKEFMPAGVTKEIFTDFIKYYDRDIFIAAGKRIRRLAAAADKETPTRRVKQITEIFRHFKNPDKETVLTPWRVVNMHMAKTLGGWCFFNENFEDDTSEVKHRLEEPRFVDNGNVTSEIFSENSHILEINSKTGLYPLYLAYSFYKQRMEGMSDDDWEPEECQQFWNDSLRDNVYVICKTPMAKSITRRTLCGYNKATGINAHAFDDLVNMLKHKPEQFKKKVMQGAYWKKDVKEMKFDAVVGNPPYQDSVTTNNRQGAIYNYFYDIASELSDRYSLISPARFLFNAGLTPKDWNKKMLNDPHFKIIKYEPDATAVFPNTQIKGGIVISYRDVNINYGAIGNFVPNDTLRDLLKHFNYDEKHNFTSIMFGGRSDLKFNDLFLSDYPQSINDRLSAIQKVHPDVNKLGPSEEYELKSPTLEVLPYVFLENKPDNVHDYYKILGLVEGERTYRWILKKYMVPRYPTNNNLSGYKVFIPKASGNGNFGEKLSKPVIAGPDISATPSFISIGNFSTEIEAVNTEKYIRTKFARTLLSVLKITQDIVPSKWAYVPIQDFTDHSDIDWSKSLSEIDSQLYKKYGLSNDEIDFIEKNVQPME